MKIMIPLCLASAIFSTAWGMSGRAPIEERIEEIAVDEEPELIDVRLIWDEAPHNAFTGLARFRGDWYCAFREGSAHRSADGNLRVLRSTDGIEWESIALMEGEDEGDDIRDAQLSITADGQLMLNGSITLKGDPDRNRQSVTWLSADGINWEGPFACPSGDNTWRWSVTWHGDYGYSPAYTGKDRAGTLYRTADGKTWSTVVENMFPQVSGARPSEASLVFEPDGTAFCLLRFDPVDRRDRFSPQASARLGTARPPYRDWHWESLGVRMGGPKLLRLEDGRLLAGARCYGTPEERRARTAIFRIDPEQASADLIMHLPSGGDTSYPGMVEHDGIVWISYYSSHEGKSNIYLARLRLP